MNFEQKTVGEIAAEYPAAIRVFERLRIDYCCGGATPLASACTDAGITLNELSNELQNAVSTPVADAIDFASMTAIDIANHIIETYHRYTREELVTLRALAEKVAMVHRTRHSEVVTVDMLVRALEEDLLPHLMKEEVMLFPYVEQLERGETPNACFATVQAPVRVMMMEHETVGELLRQLRATTDGFTTPPDACFSYRELYRRLGEFEAATHQHIHIENNIYFPRALQLEEAVAGCESPLACAAAHEGF